MGAHKKKIMNFMSKSKSYLLSDEKSVKKRISFGFTNKAIYDKSLSFDNDSNCVLKKVNSHEFLDQMATSEDTSNDLDKMVSQRYFWVNNRTIFHT